VREALDQTQQAIADRAGITVRAYRDIETGRSSPSLETARKGAAAYGTRVDALFPDVKDAA
jgi:DNA-binding XRE family transcriptional regulator